MNQLLLPSTCASKIVYLTTLGCQPMATLATHRFPLPMPVVAGNSRNYNGRPSLHRVSHDLRIDHVVHLINSIQCDRPHTNRMIMYDTYKYPWTILPLYTRFFWGRLSPKTLKSRAQLITRNCSTTRNYIYIVIYIYIYIIWLLSFALLTVNESHELMDLQCLSFRQTHIMMPYNSRNNRALPRTWRL